MELNEEHIKTLLCMGFHLEDVRRALAFARNDLQEAVAILTDDHPTTRYTSLYEAPVNTGSPYYGPLALISSPEPNIEQSNNAINEEQIEFPLANLYELENRVYTDTWSIPYKKEESLSKCLMSAVSYAKQGICDSDPNCHRFMYKCMPEAFNKLLTSNVVHRWLGEVQEGIYEMLQSLIQLVLIRLQSDPIPLELVNLMAVVFDSESEFCLKNKGRFSEKSQHWEEVFGEQIYAVRPMNKDPHGWLTDLINHFAELKGFEIVRARLEQYSTDISITNALFLMFSKCAEFLNPEVVQPCLYEGMISAIRFAKELEDFKEKKVGNVCEMLLSLKMISLHLCPDLISELDCLRADITLKMLKSTHFNARMNGIKEVTRMIQETKSNRMSRLALPQDEVIDWIVNKRVLSIALDGSIDKSQYCGHIKDIVDFLGHRLLDEEIAKIWSKQSRENSVVVDNIHNIITAAAAKFSTEQFQFLVTLIERTWKVEGSLMREKLIKLIGRIGRSCDNQLILMKALEFLWEISHLPDLKSVLLERALVEHHSILNESVSTREAAKKLYIQKCMGDIKESRLILPALKHLKEIVRGIGKSNSLKAEKELLQEINREHDVIGLVTESLSRCHSVMSEDSRTLEVAHQNYVTTHLEFLQFILSGGCFYLPWIRCRELWKTLVEDPLATLWDKETCFNWFSKCIKDFEHETQSRIFQQELLTLRTQYLSQAGFECFRCFFEEVNGNMNKLKKINSSITVDNADLVGLNFLWDVCLSTPDNSIAESAISMLLSVSYVNLAPKFKRNQDLDGLHQKFIDIWYSWLSKVKNLFEKFKDQQSSVCLDLNQSHKSAMLGVERLLMVAERYVVSVEEFYVGCRRSLPPHGATFWGQQFKLRVVCDVTKNECSVTVYRNETVDSLKQKIGRELKISPDLLQFMPNEKVPNKEQKRLFQLDLHDNQVLNVRILSSSVCSISQDSSARHSMDLEHERMLPGVIMCSDGQIFRTLYQLVSFDNPRITNKARQLLRLVPTDPKVLQSFEAIQARPGSAASLDPHDSIRMKVLSSPSKHQKSHADLPEKLLPSFGTILKSKVTPSSPLETNPGDCSGLASSTILPPIRDSPSSSSPHSTLSRSLPRDWMKSCPSTRTPKEILESMLSPSSSGLSVFQVLYNLEVLSSKLMPVDDTDPVGLQASEAFCRNFLDADGLGFVISLLQRELPACDGDFETKQGCYDTCLQLLRFLLAFDTEADKRFVVSSSLHVDRSSRPSTGPACKLVQAMSEEEFSNLISCFMKVAWAAATGKLQVMEQQVSHKDSAISVDMRSTSNPCMNSGHSTGSIESGWSSSSEVESMACVSTSPNHDGCPETLDKYIACEALQLFVTCLRLKPTFMEVFYALPRISDFVVDVLVTSPYDEVRSKAMEQFHVLSRLDVSVDRSNNNIVIAAAATVAKDNNFDVMTAIASGDERIHHHRDDNGESWNRLESKPRSTHHFVLNILTRARLPFWVPSANVRSFNYRLLKQSSQYFTLLSQLLANLTCELQGALQLDVGKMLEDEVKWLENFVCLENSAHSESDNILLAGHLRVIRILLTCEGVDKRKYGSYLVQDILYKFLFPAAKMILDCSMSPDSENNLTNFAAKCSKPESRVAAYDLLVELATGDVENMATICKELISMHHATQNSDMANSWEYMPPVEGRNPCGYVGLKNGGATCYMNSLIQQIFMTPGITEHILGIDDDHISDDSILFQMQQVLGHLQDSKLQHYIPEGFWGIFKLWGSRVNIREQQDALDFFQSLIDQLDEEMKKLGREQIFKKTFQGLYSDQKICHGCKHRYEQEEAFFALNVTVKNATLQDSLDQFVKGEVLDGDNAYKCEMCGIKRDTTKRLCVKLLPPVLCIQLKRFDYDWEANRAIKFDDHFKFPLVLDMEPYTAEGMAWREEQFQSEDGSDSDVPMTPTKFTSEDDEEEEDEGGEGDRSSDDPSMEVEIEPLGVEAATQKRPRNINTSFSRPSSHVNFELVGVVIHSGQANAGHYYSFIKERRGSYATNPNKGKWFKFNDTTVEEFDMNEVNLESECFGGKYKSKTSDSSSYQFPEERQRYWNGYLLFYEKVEDVKTPVSAKKSKVSGTIFKTVSEKSVLCRRQDSLKQLTDLVHKGEKRGLFGNKMPARVQLLVQAENLQFVKNRNVFESEYFNFIHRLASANLYLANTKEKTELGILSLELACKFLLGTYYRTNQKLRMDMTKWETTLIQLINQSEETCMWMVDFLANEGLTFIKPLLLDCPTKEIRCSMEKYLEKTMSCFYRFEGFSVRSTTLNKSNFDKIVECLLALLNKEVSVIFRQSQQYFQVLFNYARLNVESRSHLLSKNAFTKLMEFLLGPLAQEDQHGTSRRWGPLQSKDFGLLHSTLALLVIHCDVTPHQTHASSTSTCYSPMMLTDSGNFVLPDEVASFVFGGSSARYLHEVVMALRELTSSIEYIFDLLCYCSFNNRTFSFCILSKIFFQCVTAPSNELRHIFQALLHILLLTDELQHERLIFIMEEVSDDKLQPSKGMLALIKQYHSIQDSKRSYHFIKFLVNLSSSCTLAKDYLLTVSAQWEWAVRWLESKMSENCWGVQMNMSNEETISHSFQRTISAQDTLAGATALLTEIDHQDPMDCRMDISNSSSLMNISRCEDDDDDGVQGPPSGQARPAGHDPRSSPVRFSSELPLGDFDDDLL